MNPYPPRASDPYSFTLEARLRPIFGRFMDWAYEWGWETTKRDFVKKRPFFLVLASVVPGLGLAWVNRSWWILAACFFSWVAGLISVMVLFGGNAGYWMFTALVSFHVAVTFQAWRQYRGQAAGGFPTLKLAMAGALGISLYLMIFYAGVQVVVGQYVTRLVVDAGPEMPRDTRLLLWSAPPYKRGDIVNVNGWIFERIIAVPGEFVEIKDQHIFINGQASDIQPLEADLLKEGVFQGLSMTVHADCYAILFRVRYQRNNPTVLGITIPVNGGQIYADPWWFQIPQRSITSRAIATLYPSFRRLP